MSRRSTISPSASESRARNRSPAALCGHDLAQAPGVGDDARTPGGHRLEGDEPERLVDRRDHADVGDPVERVEDVVADPTEEGAVVHQPERRRLFVQLLLVGSRAGDQEARPRDRLDQARHRLERELEALLVDEPADQQHEPLVRGGELSAEALELGIVLGLQVLGVDPVRDHRDAALVDAEDVDDLLAHVIRAGDHAVGAVGDPALDPVDVPLGVVVDPTLVSAVLGGVDRRHQRRAEAPREVVARHRDEPVVAVDEVEFVAVAELDAGGEHVRVHALDPGDELAEVGRTRRLAHPVDVHLRRDLLRRRLLAAAGEDVDLDPVAGERLGELANVAGQPALDQRRVLPGEDEDSGQAGYLERCSTLWRPTG